MLPSETMIWQPEFTDKTLSRKPGAVQVVIPKSTHQQRIEENFAIWDFSLTEKEMAQISSLDLGYVGESVKHFNPEFVRGCLAVKIHD
ncbi:hypothetical protein E4U69_23410 [Escherichia coli O157:H7]|nr:hypothetical protein E4U69_23410 [Escherichia coli O157:H7]